MLKYLSHTNSHPRTCSRSKNHLVKLSQHLIYVSVISAIDKFARENNCQARGSTGEHSEVIDRIDISNLRRLGFPEYQLVDDMIKTVNKLSEMEDQA